MLLFPSWQGQSKPSLPLSFFLLFSISSQSPTPTIFCCCSSFSSHSFQSYLNINTVLPSVFFASFFSQLSGQLISASFSSAICFTLPAHFSLVLTNFFLKLSFPPISISSSILLLSALFTHMILLIQLFLQYII